MITNRVKCLGYIIIFIYGMRYSYKRALEVLTDWAVREGYEDISFDHTDVSYIDWKKDGLNTPKNIKIQGKYSTEIKTYILLHELGHHQLRKNWGRFEKTLPVTAYAENVDFLRKE